jgi:hypothetical protein
VNFRFFFFCPVTEAHHRPMNLQWRVRNDSNFLLRFFFLRAAGRKKCLDLFFVSSSREIHGQSHSWFKRNRKRGRRKLTLFRGAFSRVGSPKKPISTSLEERITELPGSFLLETRILDEGARAGRIKAPFTYWWSLTLSRWAWNSILVKIVIKLRVLFSFF